MGYDFRATSGTSNGSYPEPPSAGYLQKSFDAVTDKDAALCLNLLSRKAMQRWDPPAISS